MVEGVNVAERGAYYFLAALVEHCRVRIFEEHVEAGITLGELGGDFGAQIVFLVFGFPEAPVLAQGIFQRAVGDDAMPGFGGELDFGDQDQVFAVGVLLQQVLKRLTQGAFVARAAVADEFFDFGVVLLDELDGHSYTLW